MAIEITLLHFAVLREIAGVDRERRRIADGSSPLDLWRELREAHPELHAYPRPPFTAVNETWADPETTLRDGDVVAFIPPVSGG